MFSQGKRRALGDENQERVEKTLWRHFEQQVAGGADPETALKRVLRAEDAARNDGIEVWEGWMERLLAPGGKASVDRRCDALQAVGRVSFAVPEKEMAAVFECQEKLLERGWNDTDIKTQLAHLSDHISTALGSEGRLRHEEAPGTFVEFCQQLPQLSKSYTMGWMLDSWHDGFQPERARQLAELKGHQIEGWLQEFFPKLSQADAETVLKSSWIHKGDSNRPDALREDTATRSILRFMGSRQKAQPDPEKCGKETLRLTLHLGHTMSAEAIASVFNTLHDLPEERLTTVKSLCDGSTWPPIALELEGLAANSKLGLAYSDSVKLLDGLGLTQLGFYREPGVRSKAWNAMESAVLGGRPLEQVRREILRLAAPEQGSTGNAEFPQHIENYQSLSPDLQPKYASLASLVPEPEVALNLVQRSQQVPGFDLESAYLRPPSTQDGKASQAALEQALAWTEQGVPAALISAALSRDYLFEGRLKAKDVQGQLDSAVLKPARAAGRAPLPGKSDHPEGNAEGERSGRRTRPTQRHRIQHSL